MIPSRRLFFALKNVGQKKARTTRKKSVATAGRRSGPTAASEAAAAAAAAALVLLQDGSGAGPGGGRQSVLSGLARAAASGDTRASMMLSQALAGKALIENSLRQDNVAFAADIMHSMKQLGVPADLDTYHALVKGWLAQGNAAQALDWVQKMRRDGRQPNAATFRLLVNGFARLPEPIRNLSLQRAAALLNSMELPLHSLVNAQLGSSTETSRGGGGQAAAPPHSSSLTVDEDDPGTHRPILLVATSKDSDECRADITVASNASGNGKPPVYRVLRPVSSGSLLETLVPGPAADGDRNQVNWASNEGSSDVADSINGAGGGRRSLSFDDGSSLDGDQRQRMLFEQQLSLEADATEAAVRRYHGLLKVITKLGHGASLKPAQAVLLSWYRPLVRRIKAEQRLALTTSDQTRSFLLLLSAQKLAVIAMHQALGLVLRSPAGVTFTTAAVSIGKSVQAEVNLQRLKQERGDLYWYLNRHAKSLTVNKVNKLQRAIDDGQWDKPVLVQLGACLLKCVLESCYVTDADDSHTDGSGPFSSTRHTVHPDAENMVGADEDAGDEWWPLAAERPGPRRRRKSMTPAAAGPTFDQASDGPSSANDSLSADHTDSGLQQRLSVDQANGGRRPRGSTSTAVAAFQHTYHFRGVMRTGMFCAHPRVFSLIERGHQLRETVEARHLPMVVEPQPWTDTDKGGYLLSRVRVMRTRGSNVQQRALTNADLTSVYRALTALGRTPWQVNEPVLQVASEAWAAGGDLADLPSRTDPVAPPKPTASELEAPGADATQLVQQWRNASRAAAKVSAELHSLRCDTRYKLQLAREFVGRTMYFPHNLDFRGRVYPIPPHLNHMGSDLCRGLLQFAESRPLGPDGLRWLKVQLANVYGHGKLSFRDRVRWVDDHIHLVEQAAERPLADGRGRDFWLAGEDPWQCLAACYELAAALRWAGRGDHTDAAAFPSSLPVHQDGTCNGLQHYAALGGDAAGARAVNLASAIDRPQDVYAEVAVLVEQAARRDPSPLGQLCADLVTRRVVKQTVMTSVYGVTFVGANLQIRRQLADRMAGDQLAAASAYLTRKTFDALREMFVSARAIMEWLALVARLVGRHGQPASWTTPLGLRCVQPYRRSNKRLEVKTLVQTVILVEDSDSLPVNVQRQATAFPPNYIHSLDSTHLMLTALECERRGIPFAAVHDSFWSHAGLVGPLAEVLRGEFVDMHRLPLLDRLRQELLAQNPGLDLPLPPERGSFDVTEVLKAPYFFS